MAASQLGRTKGKKCKLSTRRNSGKRTQGYESLRGEKDGRAAAPVEKGGEKGRSWTSLITGERAAGFPLSDR